MPGWNPVRGWNRLLAGYVLWPAGTLVTGLKLGDRRPVGAGQCPMATPAGPACASCAAGPPAVGLVGAAGGGAWGPVDWGTVTRCWCPPLQGGGHSRTRDPQGEGEQGHLYWAGEETGPKRWRGGPWSHTRSLALLHSGPAPFPPQAAPAAAPHGDSWGPGRCLSCPAGPLCWGQPLALSESPRSLADGLAGGSLCCL